MGADANNGMLLAALNAGDFHSSKLLLEQNVFSIDQEGIRDLDRLFFKLLHLKNLQEIQELGDLILAKGGNINFSLANGPVLAYAIHAFNRHHHSPLHSAFIIYLINHRAIFSIEDLVKICITSPYHNPLKMLFNTLKKIPQLAVAFPHLNQTDEAGNTLLLNLLITFLKTVKNYIQETSEITEYHTGIPFKFANQLQVLNKLCQTIKYLLSQDIDKAIKNHQDQSVNYFLEATALLIQNSTHPKPFIIPLENMLKEILLANSDRLANEPYPFYQNTTFFKYEPLASANSSDPLTVCSFKCCVIL